MSARAVPPAVSVVGRKNSGKTTLTVAVAAELRRRGYRIATLKHGHHGFEIDQPGRDSWRHFHEGEAEAVMIAAAGKLAMVMRLAPAEEADPAALIERFYAGRGYDLVIVEGYKTGALPKIEVFRRAVHTRPLYDPSDAAATAFLGIVTDDAALDAAVPVIGLDTDLRHGDHVAAVADLLESRLTGGPDAD